MSCDLDVLRRLERLERRCRNGRIGLMTAAFVGAMVAGGINAQDPKPLAERPEPPTREVARMILRDSRNRTRAALDLAPDGTPALMFFDDTGARRLSLALSPDGEPGVRLFGPNGQLASSIQNSDRLGPSLSFVGKQGNETLRVGAGDRNFLGLSFWDARGRRRISMGMQDRSHLPLISIQDDKGEILFQTPGR